MRGWLGTDNDIMYRFRRVVIHQIVGAAGSRLTGFNTCACGRPSQRPSPKTGYQTRLLEGCLETFGYLVSHD